MLILQPWGWRYRSLTQDGQPSEESKTQMKFYYEKLSGADGQAWLSIASSYACGDKWPSLDELISALRRVQPKSSQIEDQRPREQPEVIGKILEYTRKTGVGFVKAMRAVLPGWVEQHPQDETAAGMLTRMGMPPTDNGQK